MVEHSSRRGPGRSRTGQRFAALACLVACVGLALPSRAVARPPAEPDPPPIPLEVGKPFERTVTESGTISFAIALAAGDYVSVVGADHGIANACVLRDPSEAEALTTWEVMPHQTERTKLEYVAEVAGTYTLSYDLRPPPTDPPALRVELAEKRPATAIDRERATLFRLTSDAIRDVEALPQTAEARTRGIAALEAARPRWRALGDERHEIVLLSELANAYSYFGRHHDSVRLLDEAVAVARRIGDREKLGALLVDLAGCYVAFGDWKTADAKLDEGLALFDALGGGGWWEFTANDIRGLGMRTRGDFRGARAAYARVAEIGKRLGLDQDSVAGSLAAVDRDEGRLVDVLPFYEAAAAKAAKGNDLFARALAFSDLAAIRGDLGDYQGAIDAAQLALAASTEDGYAISISWSLNRIGYYYMTLGQLDEAESYFARGLRLAEERGFGALVVDAKIGVGRLHLTRGEPAEALEAFESSEAILNAGGMAEGMASALSGVAEAYAALGDLPRAEAAFERAVAYSDDRSKAIEQEGARLAYGAALAGRDAAKVAPALERALEIGRAIRDRPGIATALYHLARLDRDAGRLASAKARIREAIDIVESLRSGIKGPALRTSYFAKVRPYYDLYADVLMREGGTASAAEAFAVAERGRGRVLLETLTERGVDLAAGVDPKLRTEEQDARRRLIGRLDYQVRLLGREHAPEEADALARDIAELERRVADAEGRLRAASPAYAALTSPEPVTVDALRRDLLDDRTALVAYEVGEDAGYVWAVTADGIASARLPGRTAIEARVKRLREAVAARACAPRNEAADEREARLRAADAAYLKEARALGEEILGPVAKAVAGRRLAIVPDGALALVPFGALVEPGTDRYVIEGHEVVTLPSATALRTLREQAAKRAEPAGAVAIVADPVFDATDARVTTAKRGEAAKSNDSALAVRAAAGVERGACGERAGLERLRGSAREAEAIAALAPEDKRLAATGFEANLELATGGELGKYKVVHFATHGYVPAGAPELSGLVLSLVDRDGRERPGYLGMPQIYGMRLPVEAVVLSACETGLGREVSGEGQVGLVRGFMYAGASRVVSSLWKIDDEGTAGLMGSFYEGMLKRGRTPAAALREAQLKAIAAHEPAYVWGAFQLAGEWR